MTAHLHSTFIEGCYRCDLSRDEAFIPEHVCNADEFDCVICAEPCRTMHTYCSVCGDNQEPCALDDEE